MLKYETHNAISIASFLERAKNQYPDSPAITFKDKTYTWQRVYERTVMLACHLRDRRIGAGDRVAVISENTNNYIEMFFACSFIGAVIVPISSKLTDNETNYILDDCDASIVFRGISDSVYNSVWDIEPFEPSVDDDPVAIIYTSGSTGKPKGAVVSHRGYYINSVACKSVFDLHEQSNTLIAGPLSFAAVINRLMVSVFLQHHIVLLEKFDAEKIAQTIEEYEINTFTLAPSMLKMLLSLENFYDYDYTSLKNVQYAGESMPKNLLVQLAETFPYVDLYDSYGSTETGTMLCNGKLVSHMDAKIVDGELQVRGPTVIKGYWLLPNTDAFDNGWYKTGDSAIKDGDKYIITGRVKEMILSGGINIYPAEIENILIKHPDVDEVVVVGVPDDKWGQVPHAFIVGKQNGYESYCREHLAGFKVPKKYTYLESLPLNSSGKVDKKALKLL